MKFTYILIVSIVVLIAVSLNMPITEEQKYCDQFSGESIQGIPSDEYLSCQKDSACIIENASSLSAKVTDAEAFNFLCIPNNIEK